MLQTAAKRGFVHEAFLYAGEEEFLAGTVPFIRDGVASGEPVMVAVSAPKVDLLRSALQGRDDGVLFVDMDQIGGNPARIIPAWHDFLDHRAPGHRPVRGIGEPIGPHRSAAALLECQRHEVLLNAAFDGRPGWWLLCPYDTASLRPEVIDEAGRSHRYVFEHGEHRCSSTFDPCDPAGFAEQLPEPTTPVEAMQFGHGGLAAVRRFVTAAALRRDLGPARLADLLVAVNELATNSVCHGGGRGTLRVWHDTDEVVCEVSDDGVIREPLVGRRRPDAHREGGRGLWIVNQLCDLVEMRGTDAGTVVRAHVSRP